MSSGQPLKWKTPEELEQKIQEYYKWVAENKGERICVTGLAMWLGCSKQTLQNYEFAEENNWLKRLDEETRHRYIDSIKRAKRKIEYEYEKSLFNRSEAVGAIFTLKNNYNWVDKQEIVQKTQEITVDIVETEE